MRIILTVKTLLKWAKELYFVNASSVNFIKIVNKNMKRILEGKQLNIQNSNGFLMMRYIFQASGSEP